MKKILLYIITSSSIILSFNSGGYMEVDIGINIANGEYDRYNDDGFTIRATYSNNISSSDFFRWQVSGQYISFYSNTYSDEFEMASGNGGPSIEVTNSEDGYIFQGGLKFIPELGLFQDKGIFKPYTTLGLGFGYFLEYTKYEDPDISGDWCNVWDWWCDDDGGTAFRLDDIEQDEFNFIYSVELGANFIIPKWNNGGFDFGVRYTMSPKMKPVNIYSYDDLDSKQLNKFADKINADYITIYIGGTWPINTTNNKSKTKPIDFDI